jgi:hypothetical protein
MNIFYLDNDVNKCAEYHCDKHIVKMTLETAQLLCSAHWVVGGQAPYKLAHKNHPCSIWVRSSLSNYIYLCNLGLALCSEYEYRYNKIHKSKSVISWCLTNLPDLKDIGLTPPALAMPEQYKSSDPVKAYRNYYIYEKSFAKWKFRSIPFWYYKGHNFSLTNN